MEQIDGRIERINFYKPENGFLLARIRVNGRGNVTIVGRVETTLSIGQHIKLCGAFQDDEKYGRQFRFSQYEIIKDDPTMGIRLYLASRRFQGIGYKLANQIVDTYGQTTLKTLLNGTGLHGRIKGLTASKTKSLIKTIREFKDENEIYITLMQQGITFNAVEKIIKLYGSTTLIDLKNNPYLLMQIDGFGFFMCDALAQKNGMNLSDMNRLSAGLLQGIKDHGNREGHTWVSEGDLLQWASRLLGVDESLLVEPLKTMVNDKTLVEYLKNDQKGYMLPMDFKNEKTIALAFKRMKKAKHDPLKNKETLLDEYQKSLDFSLDQSQLDAIQKALEQPLMILTGGPGTGKTTIVKAIVSIFSSAGLSIELAAPTGKAAKRLSESCGREAKTIHRLLECYFDKKTGTPRFKRNKRHPLAIQALIVDECSMMDCAISAKLLEALPNSCRLILVGDEDQLPSVGAGNVFSDLIHSAFLPLSRLSMIHRQKNTSYIPLNASLVIQGKMPKLIENRKMTDFWFVNVHDNKDIADATVSLVASLLKLDKIDPSMIQVLTPMKKGDEGTLALNPRLKALFNPDTDQKNEVHGMRVNDRVIQTSNNYSMGTIQSDGKPGEDGVFNGDMGNINLISEDKNRVGVVFNDGTRSYYQFDEINQLEMAYALTVHKSQGSEFDIVVMPLPNGYPMIINRRLLYTAITRAKKMMILVSTVENLRVTIANNQISTRMTILADLLQ